MTLAIASIATRTGRNSAGAALSTLGLNFMRADAVPPGSPPR